MKLKDIIQLCKGRKNVYIFGHINPDGDCIGATLGLKHLLKKYEIEARVVLKDPPEVYEYLGVNKYATDCVNEPIDLAIALDSSDLKRLAHVSDEIKAANTIINIDHHISNTNFGHYNYVVEEISSTSEIIYSMIEDDDLLDKEIAEALYTGFIYDTGVFKHSSTFPSTMKAAGHLISYGIDFTEIINQLFAYKSIKTLKASARGIDNVEMYCEEKIALTVMSQEDIDELQITKDNTDSIVQMLNEIEGVECAIFIYQLPSCEYKVSLRSRGEVDVCQVARTFGGGGHVKASGCSSDLPIEELKSKFIELISKQVAVLS